MVSLPIAFVKASILREGFYAVSQDVWILSGPCDALPTSTPLPSWHQGPPLYCRLALRHVLGFCWPWRTGVAQGFGVTGAVPAPCRSGAGLRTSRGSTRVQESHLGAGGTRARAILVCTGVHWSTLGPMAALPCGQDTPSQSRGAPQGQRGQWDLQGKHRVTE